MKDQKTIEELFLSLLRGGLWEQEVLLAQFERVDLKAVYRIAEEQAVLGLVAAGLEHVVDVKIPKDEALLFAGQALLLEHRNKAMDLFIADLIMRMRQKEIYTLLVKGQGIAQCYERPLWRSSGDIDLLLDFDSFQRAKEMLLLRASSVDEEISLNKHIAFTISSWVVELHGTLHSGLGRRVDNVIDRVQNDSVLYGNVRTWRNGKTDVFLPSPDNDVVFVFSHILQHFFKGGVGLRQVCDWCRLLWTYGDKIDINKLEHDVRNMGLMTEWKAFAALAVCFLGMPEKLMPFYSPDLHWGKKAKTILSIIFNVGNFGHNRDSGYYAKYPVIVSKIISLWRHLCDSLKYFSIFPYDATRILCIMFTTGIKGVLSSK